MALITWKNDYSVGVAEIDAQHKIIIKFINDLNDAMSQGKGKEALGTILGGLIEYTATHFAHEERYFDQFNYHETLRHKAEHKALVDNVVALKGKFDAGSLSLSIETMNFLKNWLTNHIAIVDKKYTTCFNENGVI